MYNRVYQLKQDFPQLHISINGGIKTWDDMHTHLQHVDGVMVGRQAYQDPYLLSQVDRLIFDDHKAVLSREEVVLKMIPYIQKHLQQGGRLNHISRHMIGLFQGVANGRAWRRYISENATQPGADERVILDALKQLQSNT